MGKHNLDKLIDRFKSLNYNENQLYDVIVTEHDDTRSSNQNRRYWQLLHMLGDHLGYSALDMHELMLFQFTAETKEVAGHPVTTLKSTARMKVKEFNEYMEMIESWGQQFGFKFDYDLGQESVMQ